MYITLDTRVDTTTRFYATPDITVLTSMGQTQDASEQNMTGKL